MYIFNCIITVPVPLGSMDAFGIGCVTVSTFAGVEGPVVAEAEIHEVIS